MSGESSGLGLNADVRELVGVIHVHSIYSDGSGSVEEIAGVAQAQGLDYVILTDHNTLQGRREGKAARYGKTLVLVDEEISTKGGHYLALRVPEEVPPYRQAQETVDAVRAAGGLGFIAHPFARRGAWKDHGTRGMTGLEIYSAREDMEDENMLALGIRILLFGADFSTPGWLDRPEKSLKWWDRLLAGGGRVVGIGSTNAHGLRWLGLRFGPYPTLFKLVRTHLLVTEEPGEPQKRAIYRALERGNLFVSHAVVSDARGFRFSAVKGDVLQGIMGEEVRWSPGLCLFAELPSAGRITFFQDGWPVAEMGGLDGRFDVPAPGVYRLEVTREGRPWIYSNPIYVVE